MYRMKNTFLVIILCFSVVAFVGCTKKRTDDTSDGKRKVVATVFAEYDFLRNIAGNKIDLTMLLKPGADLHAFEPTPKDMADVQNADLFVTIGGESDAWAERIVESADDTNLQTVRLMDFVDKVVEEEPVPGENGWEDAAKDDRAAEANSGAELDENGQAAEADGGTELDEHVWTSPKNAVQIVQGLTETLCRIDKDNAGFYQKNAKRYIKKLNELDREFADVVSSAKRNVIIVADRFPFRYFADAYGLEYYAAFPGCSVETGASTETVSFLIDKVKEEQIPVVFHVEMSSEAMCDTICEETGAKKAQLNAVHNVSQTDFENGKGYYELMKENIPVLEEALN